MNILRLREKSNQNKEQIITNIENRTLKRNKTLRMIRFTRTKYTHRSFLSLVISVVDKGTNGGYLFLAMTLTKSAPFPLQLSKGESL